MKYAFVMPVRDKAPYVAESVRSILGQTELPDHSTLELVFSDQGSQDGTLDIIKREVQSYNGPHAVRVLECPETEPRGMRGLIAHINWLHGQHDADYWIITAGDDVSLPDRAKRTAETIEELGSVPNFFATSQYNALHEKLQDGESHGRNAFPKESRFVDPVENLQMKVGGSTTNAWHTGFFESLHPLPPQALVDVAVPHCAALTGGFYYLNEPHHVYVCRPDPNNTGLEGLFRMTEDEDEKLQVMEMAKAQLTANMALLLRMTIAYYRQVPDPATEEAVVRAVYDEFVDQADEWQKVRLQMTLKRLPPRLLVA